jgi:hypothetical protein
MPDADYYMMEFGNEAIKIDRARKASQNGHPENGVIAGVNGANGVNGH